MKVSDYLPYLYDTNIEMNSIIDTEELEFENTLKIYLNDAFCNNFVKLATIQGIEKFEKLLNIQLDENKDNIEYRRARVLAKLTASVPFSYRWLEENLTNLVGKDNFYIDLDPDLYKLTISISNVYINTALTLYNIYRPIIPANLILIVNLFDEVPANFYFGALLQEGEETIYESEVL